MFIFTAKNNNTMEPSLMNTSHMTFVDGRCGCCPYGYHIDLDFLRYLNSLNSESLTAAERKKARHNKKKLRQSMEFFLNQQQIIQSTQQSVSSIVCSPPPPDVVNSTEAARKTDMLKLLKEIDDSVDAQMTAMGCDVLNQPSSEPYQLYFSDTESKLGSSSEHRQNNILMTDCESCSSVSASSGPSSPISNYFTSSNKEAFLDTVVRNKSDSKQNNHQKQDNSCVRVTGSGHEAPVMATSPSEKAPQRSVNLVEKPGQSTNQTSLNESGVEMTRISSATLQAIREQMATSLKRMRELEEQVKAIPPLQVSSDIFLCSC